MKRKVLHSENFHFTRRVKVIFVLFFILIFAGALFLIQANPAIQSDTGTSFVPGAECTAAMKTTALSPTGAIAWYKTLPSNPFYVQNTSVNRILVDIDATVVLTGDPTNFSEPSVSATISANDVVLISRILVEASENHYVTSYTIFLDSVFESDTAAENYDLIIQATVTLSVDVNASTTIRDSVTLSNTWTFDSSDSGFSSEPPAFPSLSFLKSEGPFVALPGQEIEITFKPRSEHPLRFEIFENNVLFRTGDWDGGDINHIFIFSSNINVRVTVHDTYGQSASYTHAVQISREISQDIPTIDPGPAFSPFLTSTIGVMSITIAALGFGIGLIVIMRRRKQ